jgi:hypothetical protein
MKPGKTILKENNDIRFPPTVEVGTDQCRVFVDFGTVILSLSATPDGSVIIVRGDAYRAGDAKSLPLAMRTATDVRNTVEFHFNLEDQYRDI